MASTRPGPARSPSPRRVPRAASRRSASTSRTRASGAWASAPARLIAVRVLPSETPGLETATTERSADLWSCSTRWRRARYCSASNDAGASRLTRCSSSPSGALRGRSRGGSGARSVSGTAGPRSLVPSGGAGWRRRAFSCSARSSAFKNLLTGLPSPRDE